MNELAVLLDGQEAGRVHRNGDRLRFEYAESWRRSADAYPLSLSMPLTAREHSHRIINAFIWGLLPDNDRILERWARQFQVSARSAFALVSHVGEDCAGAVQFVRPERLDAVEHGGTIQWLTEEEVAARLRSVVAEASTGRNAGDNGQFSLAGAQPKTALLHDRGRWGIPSGRIPTTHILKPPVPSLPGHAENEHFCLQLGKALGLRTVQSQVLAFQDQPVIAVRRYDRIRLAERSTGGDPVVVRLHQEDMCQAAAIHPERKYENDGGPSALAVLDLIRAFARDATGADQSRAAADDVRAFTDALLFNWMIAGTDAHAKNYGFLIGSGGLVRLAPFYDIASAYGLEEIQLQRMKLAMKVMRHYRVEEVVLRHWEEWAAAAGLDSAALVSRAREMAAGLPDEASAIARAMANSGLAHPVVQRLAEALIERSRRISRM